MPRPARPWFRVYVEMMHDPKIRRLKATDRWLWIAVLAAACRSPSPGLLLVTETSPMTDTDLADLAGLTVPETCRGLAALVAAGMLAVEPDGISWSVPGWKDRQYLSDISTERTALRRSRNDVTPFPQRPLQRSRNDVTALPERPQPVPGTFPESESETELGSFLVQPLVGGSDVSPSKKPGKRRSQAPSQFLPTVAQQEWAAGLGVTDVTRETEQFLDHHRAKGTLMTDWDAAWRTWCRNAVKYAPATTTGNGHGTVPQSSLPPTRDAW